MESCRYGLIGRTLGHSFSVPIHLAFGCPEYSLVELEPEELGDFMLSRRFSGINVTIPYKRDVMALCDRISPEAEKIGAVNTVVNRGGELWGYNTDIRGFEYMVRSAGIDFSGRKVLVLGSGGASHAVTAASPGLGARETIVISRKGENNYSNLYLHSDADIIVNTTPVGMYPDCPTAPLDLALFPCLSGVVDVVYNPYRTGLMMRAEELGIPHVSGLKMLVAQAARAEELFFDRPADTAQTEKVWSDLMRGNLNIVLTGMAGSGKTTVGRALASLTGRELVDTDDIVREISGMSIPEIFAGYGEERFRELETEAVASAGKRSGIIIATGGGVVTREENYPLLRQNGRIYEICRPVSLLAVEGRPLSLSAESLTAMYESRRPMYEKFRDRGVSNAGVVEDCASEIWRDFCENSCN